MQQPDKILDYLETVRCQIRWKRAQPIVLEELRNHIFDQMEAYQKSGLDDEKATDQTLAQMGDPVMVGQQLDRAHRPRPDWTLLGLTGVILLLGLVVQNVVGSDSENMRAIEHQIIWASISIVVLFASYFADFTIIGKYPKFIFIFLCALIIASFYFSKTVNGRVINVIYPLLLFPTVYAGFVYSMRNKGYRGIILCVAAFIIPAFLALFVLSLTILFLLCASCLIILTVSILKGWFQVKKNGALLILYLSTLLVLSVLGMMSLGMFGDAYAQSIRVTINPDLDSTGYGYVGTVIQQLLSHSQFIGEGLPIGSFETNRVSDFLPDINTNYLLTYLIYQFGWIALIIVVVLFTAFIVRAGMLCKKQKSVLGYLTSLAIILTFAVQIIVYIVSNLGFLLLPPLFLPLMSYGGVALVINMLLIGFLLSVFRTETLMKEETEISKTVAQG